MIETPEEERRWFSFLGRLGGTLGTFKEEFNGGGGTSEGNGGVFLGNGGGTPIGSDGTAFEGGGGGTDGAGGATGTSGACGLDVCGGDITIPGTTGPWLLFRCGRKDGTAGVAIAGLGGGAIPGTGGTTGAEIGILSVLLSLTDLSLGIPPANKLPN